MKKTPIIILHGWGSSSAAWEVTKQLLQKAGYQVFISDLPGFGKEPPPKNPWAVDDYVEWVLGKFGQFDKFVLIGHSFGGRIAIKLAAQYPEKVEKLVLTGSAGIRFSSLKERIKIYFYLFASKIANLVFYQPPFTCFKNYARKFLYWLAGTKDYYKIESSTVKEIFKNVINEDLMPFLDKIKTPTLLLWGRNDRIIPLIHGQIMEKKIIGSKLVLIDNASHSFPYTTHPEIFVEKVTKFLRNI